MNQNSRIKTLDELIEENRAIKDANDWDAANTAEAENDFDPDNVIRAASELTAETFRSQTLSFDFIKLMEDIGQLGLEKYGDESISAQFLRGNFERTARTETYAIGNHIRNHYDDYSQGTVHDVFGTRKHQLAAVAFNAMMEYQFLIAESERELG